MKLQISLNNFVPLLCFFLAFKLLILASPYTETIFYWGEKYIFLLSFDLNFHRLHWYSKGWSLRELNNWNLQGADCSFSTKYETHHAELWIRQDKLSRCIKMKIKGYWLKRERKKIMKVTFPQLILNTQNYFSCFHNRYHAKRPN